MRKAFVGRKGLGFRLGENEARLPERQDRAGWVAEARGF